MEGDNLIQEEVVVNIQQAMKAIEELQKQVGDLTKAMDDLTKKDKEDEDQKKKSTSATKKHSKEINLLTSAINKAKKGTDSLSKSLSKLKGISLGSIISGASKMGKKLYEFFGASINASEQLNMFNVVFGNIRKDGEDTFSELGLRATKFQNQLNELFSTNKAETMKFQALFQSLAVNTGVQADVAEQMSERMLLLTYDLASLYNKSEEDVAKAIQSGVYAGQTRPMRQVGVDLTQNNLGITLQELGINDRAVSDMSQAEKQILRYITAVRSASSANRDFANTINSPANQLKMLKQQFVELSVAIGNLFMRAFANILPYVNAIIMVVKEVLKTIAVLFGIETEDYNEAQGSVDDLAGGYDDVGTSANDATKAVKELKRQTLSFDQINNLTSPSKSGSGSGGGTGGAGVGAIDQRLLDALDKYDLKLGDVHNKAREIRDFIMEWLGFTKEVDEKTGEVSFKFGLIGQSSVQIAEHYGKKLAEGLNALTKDVDFAKIGRDIANGLNTAFTFVNNFVSTYNFEALGAKIGEGITSFFDDLDGGELGKTLTNKFEALTEFIHGILFKTDWGSIGNTIGEAVTSALLNINFGKVIENVQKAVSSIFEIIANTFESIDFREIARHLEEAFAHVDLREIAENLSNAIKNVFNGIGDFLDEIDWFQLARDLTVKIADFISHIDWGGIIESLWNFIWNALTGIVEAFVGFLEGLWEMIEAWFSGEEIDVGDYIEVDTAVEEIDEFKEALKKLREESKDTWQELYGETIVAEQLASELGNLLDADGKVKESERMRAEIIINKLNKALGLELEIGDDLILKNGGIETSYEKVTEQIKELIKQKRLNALVDAYMDEYKERLKQLAQDQGEYNQLVEKYGENAKGRHKERMKELEKHISKNEDFIESFDNMQYLVSNGFDEMDRSQMKMIKDWEYNSGTSLEGIAYSAEASQKYIEDTARIRQENHDRILENIKEKTGINLFEIEGKVENWKKNIKGKFDELKDNPVRATIDLIKGFSFDKTINEVNGLNNKFTPTVDIKETSKTTSFFSKLSSIGGIISGFFGKAEGGIYHNGTWHPIQQYAYGGIPSTGQLFVAREAGPELVGKIGNSTAVMNNNQIVSSVASGVAQAVKGVMAGGGGAIEVYVHTDEGTVVDRINRITRKTGECPIQF